MAEIKIRRKRPVWPWIVLILIIIVALVCYGLMKGRMGNGEDMPHIGTDEQIENGTGAYSGDINHTVGEIIKVGGSVRSETFNV
jgi:hypothetical protein